MEMTDAFAHPRHIRAVDRGTASQPSAADTPRARPDSRPHRGATGPGQWREGRLTAAPQEALPLHEARGLTAGGAQARILLDGQVYTLRITRLGKLILTK